MKKELRLIALSALVMTALGFSVVGAMALGPGSEAGSQTASATAEPKNEVVGVVSAIDANTIIVNGTVYNLAAFTEIQSGIQVGDTVKLELTTNPNGSLTVKEVNRTGSPSGASMDGTSTEPVSTEPAGMITPGPEHGSTPDMTGSNPGTGSGSIMDTNNGTRQDGSGNNTDPVSHNGQGRDSGSGPNGNGGN